MKLTIRLIIFLLCIPLAGLCIYFFTGSFEMFPTSEQQESIRIFSGSFILILVIVQTGLFLLQMKMKHSQQQAQKNVQNN